ncbi:MAG: hypothetical protein WAK03_03555 [Methylocystis sp.]|jgi:hypothetical protein
MYKLTLAATVAFLGLSASAMAGQSWNVTEEGTSGIKGAQGVWAVNVQGDKLSGTADMQLTNGNPLSYKVDGAIKDGVYTVTISDRTDGKKGCVWTGHTPAGGGTQTHGLIGEAQCEGVKLILRAGF